MLFRCLLCLLAATIATTLSAQDLPGLKVTFTSAGKTDVRSERLLALYVPAGQAPTPFLTAGPFMAKWEGDLQSPLRGTFKLSAESSGKFKLSLNGQPLLDGPGIKTVQLNKGPTGSSPKSPAPTRETPSSVSAGLRKISRSSPSRPRC